MNEQATRLSFELKALRELGLPVERAKADNRSFPQALPGDYLDPETQRRWELWQEAARLEEQMRAERLAPETPREPTLEQTLQLSRLREAQAVGMLENAVPLLNHVAQVLSLSQSSMPRSLARDIEEFLSEEQHLQDRGLNGVLHTLKLARDKVRDYTQQDARAMKALEKVDEAYLILRLCRKPGSLSAQAGLHPEPAPPKEL